MSLDPLKPCPFCGGLAELRPLYSHSIAESSDEIFLSDDGTSCVECLGCDFGVISWSPSLAVAAWNRRTPQPEDRALINSIDAIVSNAHVSRTDAEMVSAISELLRANG